MRSEIFMIKYMLTQCVTGLDTLQCWQHTEVRCVTFTEDKQLKRGGQLRSATSSQTMLVISLTRWCSRGRCEDNLECRQLAAFHRPRIWKTRNEECIGCQWMMNAIKTLQDLLHSTGLTTWAHLSQGHSEPVVFCPLNKSRYTGGFNDEVDLHVSQCFVRC